MSTGAASWRPAARGTLTMHTCKDQPKAGALQVESRDNSLDSAKELSHTVPQDCVCHAVTLR